MREIFSYPPSPPAVPPEKKAVRRYQEYSLPPLLPLGAVTDRGLAVMERDAARCRPLPPITPSADFPRPHATCLGPRRPATSLFRPWHGDCEDEDGAKGEGASTPARPPHPPATGRGTMASPCCNGVTAWPPRCSPPPTSAGDGPAPPVPLPPSRGCAPLSCASRTSSPGPGMRCATPTTNAWTAVFGCPPTRDPMAPSSGLRGPMLAKPCSGGYPRASSRASSRAPP